MSHHCGSHGSQSSCCGSSCHENSCGSNCQCGCHQSCCSSGSCSSQGEECDFGAKLLCLADEAWMEVLKEKIKKQVETLHGAHLDKLADLVAKANKARWQGKKDKKKRCHEYSANLAALFECCDKECR